jgi:hypothetical protein
MSAMRSKLRSRAMSTVAGHRGIAEDEPRNRGPIAYFKPKKVTEESARELLTRSLPRASAAQIEMRVQQVMRRIAIGPIKPPAPLSQSLEEVDDPHYGLGTHPDIIEHIWKLDASLPQRCRWVFWGKPSLVHPQTGVVFLVGFGTIGYVMRLPPWILGGADPKQAKVIITGNPGQSFDIGPVGPEWRFVTSRAPEAKWCREAYDFAGEALP